MVNLSDAVRLLRAQRKELSDQLDAVDKALAALGEPRDAPRTGSEGNPQGAAGETMIAVLPTRLKPPRTLSEEHRHALREGRRKARHSQDVAAGREAKEKVGGPLMTGTIRTIRIDKGFGFIKDDGGKDYFFHQSAIYGEGLDNLREGDSVEFDVGQGPKGPRAENVRRTST